MRAHILVFAVLPALLICGAAHAEGITVTDGWIRALPAKVPAGGYFVLVNDSGRRIVLTGASSPACAKLMLHRTESESGMSTMSDVVRVPVAVGAQVRFLPGGYHLMCMEPTADIRPGNKVQVTLVFEDGSKVTSDFAVRNATGH